jgi:hypothetical protein
VTWTINGGGLRISKDHTTLVFSRTKQSGGDPLPSATASDVVSPTK